MLCINLSEYWTTLIGRDGAENVWESSAFPRRGTAVATCSSLEAYNNTITLLNHGKKNHQARKIINKLLTNANVELIQNLVKTMLIKI